MVSIISILVGALFMVVNPAQLQRKSKEAVLKARTSQLCTALNNCAAVRKDSSECDSFADLGVKDPSGDPEGAYYKMDSGETVMILGTLDPCVFRCDFNFSDGSAGGLTASDCL